MLGSPSLARALTRLGLIDDYWLNVNPVVLGAGIPFFPDLKDRIPLKLVQSKQFRSGVVGLTLPT